VPTLSRSEVVENRKTKVEWCPCSNITNTFGGVTYAFWRNKLPLPATFYPIQSLRVRRQLAWVEDSRLSALFTMTRIGWKCVRVSNALAYVAKNVNDGDKMSRFPMAPVSWEPASVARWKKEGKNFYGLGNF